MLLEVDNVIKSYDGNLALDNVSFSIREGEVVGLIGANGAGKSTVIRICTQLLSGYQGKVFFHGRDLRNVKGEDLRISYIPDAPVYFEFMTLYEHLCFFESMYRKQGFASKETLIELLKLDEHLDKTPGKLSKGTKQKMMVAMALLRDFDLLVADEPFSGLDPLQIAVVQNMFIELRKAKKSVFLSTHLIDLVDSYCDRYVVLKKGKVVGIGSEDELRTADEAQTDALLSELLSRML